MLTVDSIAQFSVDLMKEVEKLKKQREWVEHESTESIPDPHSPNLVLLIDLRADPYSATGQPLPGIVAYHARQETFDKTFYWFDTRSCHMLDGLTCTNTRRYKIIET